jgi:hypothetical protein
MGPCVWANSLLAYPSEALKYIQRRGGEERFFPQRKRYYERFLQMDRNLTPGK